MLIYLSGISCPAGTKVIGEKVSNSYLIVSSLSITKYSHGWLIDFSQQVLPFRPGVITKASKTWNFFRWRVRYLSFSDGQSRVKIVEMGKWEKAKKTPTKQNEKHWMVKQMF